MSAEIRVFRPLPTKRIQAVEWTGKFEDIPATWRATGRFEMDEFGLCVESMYGPIHPEVGEFLVRGTVREFYAMPPAVLHDKYEETEGVG